MSRPGRWATGAKHALLALVCGMSACTRPAGEPATLAPGAPLTVSFWHSMTGEKGKLLARLVDGFNRGEGAQGPRPVRVEMQFVGGYEESLNKLRTALVGHRGPHLVQVTDIGQQVMIDSGAVVPLQDFADRDPGFPLDRLLPAIRRYYEVGGRLWSLPFATSNPVIYYNRDAFDAAGIAAPPATFAELEADARRLTDSRARIVGITWPLHSWFLEEFMARQGADFVGPANGRGAGASARAASAAYLDPAALAFVALWERMAREGTLANVGRGWDPAEQNFLAGRARMLITSTSDIFEVLRQAPFRLGTAPLPARERGVRGGTVVGGNSLWILRDKPPAEREAAFRLLKYLASAPVQEEWHSHTGYFPIRGDVIESLRARGFYAKYPQAWTAIEQLRASPDLPATRGALMGVFPEAREHVMTALEEILSGRLSARDALAKAKAKTDFSLLRYNRGYAHGP